MWWWSGSPMGGWWWIFPFMGLICMLSMFFMVFRFMGGGKCFAGRAGSDREDIEKLRREVGNLREELSRLSKEVTSRRR